VSITRNREMEEATVFICGDWVIMNRLRRTAPEITRAYLDRIALLMQDDAARLTDAPGALRAQLVTLQSEVSAAAGSAADRATQAHLAEVQDRISAILELKRLPDPPEAPQAPQGFRRPAG
jgi:hypothetical protein